MASSWASSWGTSWGVSWGDTGGVVVPPVVQTPSAGGGGGVHRFADGRRQEEVLDDILVALGLADSAETVAEKKATAKAVEREIVAAIDTSEAAKALFAQIQLGSLKKASIEKFLAEVTVATELYKERLADEEEAVMITISMVM